MDQDRKDVINGGFFEAIVHKGEVTPEVMSKAEQEAYDAALEATGDVRVANLARNQTAFIGLVYALRESDSLKDKKLMASVIGSQSLNLVAGLVAAGAHSYPRLEQGLVMLHKQALQMAKEVIQTLEEANKLESVAGEAKDTLSKFTLKGKGDEPQAPTVPGTPE